MIEFFFQFKIESGGKLPSTACDACLDHVDKMWQFKEQVDRAQLLLNGLIISMDANNIVVDSQNQQPAEEPTVVEPSLTQKNNSKPEAHNSAGDQAKCSDEPEEKPVKTNKKVVWL